MVRIGFRAPMQHKYTAEPCKEKSLHSTLDPDIEAPWLIAKTLCVQAPMAPTSVPRAVSTHRISLATTLLDVGM